MKLAFVQDWFNANGGAEKVAGAILDAYEHEEISIFALFNRFSPAANEEILHNRPVNTSFLQYAPYLSRLYRYFLPLMPWAMGRFHLRNFDLIISTSHAVAKGFRADPSILNICYCHTPLRPIWDQYEDYASGHPLGRSWLYRAFVNYLRRWDYASAQRVHYFIANSAHIQQRIQKSYNRSSTVIYPPVRVHKFTLSKTPREDYYLCLGRFVPYKKIDMVIRAFQQMPDKKLALIGDGWGATQFDSLLRGYPNIEWLGYREDAEMIGYMQRAKACIFAAKEDFGILCVEAQACGTPVIALDYGGYRETVIDGATGYLFADQTEQSLIGALEKMEHAPLTDHETIRQNALRFSDDRFRAELIAFVQKANAEFHQKKAGS